MKKLGTILGWTTLGALAGYAGLSSIYAAIAMMPIILATHGLPSDVANWVFYGGLFGLVVGLGRAGVRFYIKPDEDPRFEDELFDIEDYED